MLAAHIAAPTPGRAQWAEGESPPRGSSSGAFGTPSAWGSEPKARSASAASTAARWDRSSISARTRSSRRASAASSSAASPKA
eukprot:15456540-Alexandrium_andersonii.AAC.1